IFRALILSISVFRAKALPILLLASFISLANLLENVVKPLEFLVFLANFIIHLIAKDCWRCSLIGIGTFILAHAIFLFFFLYFILIYFCYLQIIFCIFFKLVLMRIMSFASVCTLNFLCMNIIKKDCNFV